MKVLNRENRTWLREGEHTKATTTTIGVLLAAINQKVETNRNESKKPKNLVCLYLARLYTQECLCARARARVCVCVCVCMCVCAATLLAVSF